MIFRIYNDQNADQNNKDGWAAMQVKLSDQQVQTIIDPKEGYITKEITSIPSPFGRMDLIRTAFRELATSKKISGKTLHHKLVSECLDVAQIAFHLNRFRQQGLVEVIRWDRKGEIEQLCNSSYQGQKTLGDALKKYLARDAESFGFDQMEEIGLFRFKHPTTGERIIFGSTSPITLFSPAPGDLSMLSEHFTFGKDRPFDGEYCALHEREEKFVVWLYALCKHFPLFAKQMKEMYDYMEVVLKQMPDSMKQKVNELTTESYSKGYTLAEYAAGRMLCVLPTLPVRCDMGMNARTIAQRSDFRIKPYTIGLNDVAPLVLPTTQGFGHLYYTVDKWDASLVAPESDAKPLSQRELPADGSKYPYLTVGDFLEDKLLRLDNAIDERHCYPGELSDKIRTEERSDQRGYLLPLKPLFFEYFTVKDLKEYKMLRFEKHGTNVEVTLKIPIIGGEMTYTRTYKEVAANSSAMPVEGYGIVGLQLELGFLSNRVYTPITYVVERGEQLSLKCLNTTTGLWQTPGKSHKATLERVDICSTAIEGDCSVIQVVCAGDERSGMIIPNQRDARPHRSIAYAIDLGTSNSCIAYKCSDEANPYLLSWKEGELLSTLTAYNRNAEWQEYITSRLALPQLGQEGELNRMPMRTVLREDKGAAWEGAYVGSSPNYNYQYQDVTASGTTDKTNIKWGGANDHTLEAYISSLCVLLRMHADRQEADRIERITWLYPSSMSPAQQSRLKKLWTAAVATYLGKVEIVSVNEAIAPYMHLCQTAGIQGHSVAMDIGGGTVDVLFTGKHKDDDMHLTSFCLGANRLYEAPSSRRTSGSGFSHMLQNYLEQYRANDHVDGYLYATLRKMQGFTQNRQAEEAVDAFFALAKRFEHVKHKQLSMDLAVVMEENELNQQMRSFVLAYFALQIAHVAELIHVGHLAKPQRFIFSGNGSRVLSVLGDEAFLGKLISAIFEWVARQHGETDTYSIKAQFNPEPKESTTYGALSIDNTVPPLHTCLLVGGTVSKERDVTPMVAYEASIEERVYAEAESLATLLCDLEDTLHLERQYEISKAGIEAIANKLRDRQALKATWDSLISRQYEADPNYSESPIFSLMAEQLRIIGLELQRSE